MEDNLHEELAELRRRVEALEAEVARLRGDRPATPPNPGRPDVPDVPDPLRRPGPPPGTYPRMEDDAT